MNINQVQFPPPGNWQDFESLTRDLAVNIYGKIAKKNGRLGQKQNGVDIYFYPSDDAGLIYGIQCKQIDTGLGLKLKTTDIAAEVAKAEGFSPRLSHWIIATTSPKDVTVEEYVRTLSLERQREGTFSLEVWFWDDIRALIANDEDVIDRWYPEYSPVNKKLLRNSESLRETTDTALAVAQKSHEKIELVLAALLSSREINEGPVQPPINPADVSLQGQIDLARDIMRDGQPKTALDMYERLIAKHWSEATVRAKFRLLTNKGAAQLELGDLQRAAANFLEAAQFGANDATAETNVIHANLLLDKWQEATETSIKAVEKFPDDKNIAALRLLAAFHELDVVDPLSLVAESTRAAPNVLLSAGRWYRNRGNAAKAIELWEEALKIEPKNENVLADLAPALLEPITTDPQKLHGRRISQEEKANVERAILILKGLWDKAKSGEAPKRGLLHGLNLVTALRFSGNRPEVERRIAELTAIAPLEPAVIFHQAVTLLDAGRAGDAIKLLDQLPDTVSEYLGVKFSTLAALGRFNDALQIADKMLAFSEFDDNPTLQADRIVLMWHAGKREEAREAAEAKIGGDVEGIVGYTALCAILRLEEDFEGAQEIARLGAQTQAFTSEPNSRMMLGLEAFQVKEWNVAADAFSTLASPEFDSAALRQQLYALMNANRRKEAVEVLALLPESIATKPEYLRIAGLLQKRIGNLELALEKFAALREQKPKSLDACLLWLEAAEKLGLKDKIAQFFEGALDFSDASVGGLAVLAHSLDRNGFGELALAVGYKMLRDHWNEPEAHLSYHGLIFKNGSAEKALPTAIVIGPNTSFELIDDGDNKSVLTIEADLPLDRSRNEIGITDFITQQVMGHREGDQVRTNEHEHFPRMQKVSFVKHKYLHIFHESLANFNTKFPSEFGLMGFHFDEKRPQESLSTIREMLERTSENAKRVQQEYSDNNLPLTAVAKMTGKHILDVWHGFSLLDTAIKVCHGDAEEREAAFAVLEARPPLIFDTLTFWIANQLGVLAPIEKAYGKVGLVQESLEEIRAYVEERQTTAGRGYMTMTAEAGQLYRAVFTEEETQSAFEHAKMIYETAIDRVAVIPAQQMDEIDKELSEFGMTMPPSFFDTIAAANGSRRVLVSEDMIYRQLASLSARVNGVWLQPLLMNLLKDGTITQELYSKAIFSLAAAGHTFTSLDANILYYAVESDVEPTASFAKIIAMLAAPTIPISQSVTVAVEFFGRLWGSENSLDRKEKFTTAVLEALAKARPINAGLLVRVILSKLENFEGLSTTLDRWLERVGKPPAE